MMVEIQLKDLELIGFWSICHCTASCRRQTTVLGCT